VISTARDLDIRFSITARLDRKLPVAIETIPETVCTLSVIGAGPS
jgi:hypothetical protein